MITFKLDDALSTTVPARAHQPRLLNLGCGEGHPAFVNVDLNPGPGIVCHDLRTGIPFPDATYDLVYHSTMLSMMRPAEALALMRECRRVLKPGGLLRVVTEDLEQMCRVYLQKLDAAWTGDRQTAYDYDWMVLELYDQATREYPGGGMVEFLRQDPLPNEAFIYSRVGVQGRRIMSAVRSRSRSKPQSGALRWVRNLRVRARSFVLMALLGPDGAQAFEVGRFRQLSGQVSHRMYDRHSLRQLFLNAGFTGVSLKTAHESEYNAWGNNNLDISSEGEPARPHALIMEGKRPVLEA